MRRLVTLGLAAAVAIVAAPSEEHVEAQGQGQGAQQRLIARARNRPLASLAAAAARSRAAPPPFEREYAVPNRDLGADRRLGVGNLGRDPLVQSFTPSAPTNLLTQFDGSDNTDNGLNVTPPDTNGEVSSDAVDRYLQMINVVTTVFDKSGAIVPGGEPFFSNAFWLGMGGLCETNNNGDPITVYDEANDRWLVSQFAFDSVSTPPWFQCVAISQTSDPLGAYNRYAFDFGTIGFPDYPKHGIVTGSVTLIANLFNPGFIGTFIGAADKVCMYTGASPCTLVGANLGASEFGFLPGDLDDPTGAAGIVPALFGTAMTASGLFDVWEIAPDYVTPANTTITRIARVPIAAFDSDLCFASRERCVPHPGPGDDLETLSGRLMYRLQIRDFGSHLAMVAAHTVDADAAPFGTPGRAGVRWHELRSADGGANWALHQEGTHAPDDGLHRWMPSIAMNAAGDIGVGYMVSSDTTPVEIRVSGQTAAGSGSGTFDAVEALCRAGDAGADWSGRAGDYGTTTVDPTSDTFWHTNEFGRSSVFRGWGTAVCEFDVVGGPPPTPTDVHVESIVTGTLNVGRGSKRGTATVTVHDDLGNAVEGATVTGTFGGDFDEEASGPTGPDGTVTLTTQATARGGVAVTFCVSDVAHASLPYDPADNASAAFACPDPGSPPATPTGVSATAVSNSQIDVAWDDVAGETEYRVERCDGDSATCSAPGAVFAQVATVGADVVSHADTGLAASTWYSYRVLACNAGGCSSPSAIADAQTGAGPPAGAPAAPELTATSRRNFIQLRWTNVANETRYEVWREVGGLGFAVLVTLGADDTSHNDREVNTGTYAYYVTACNAAGCSDPSNQVTVVR